MNNKIYFSASFILCLFIFINCNEIREQQNNEAEFLHTDYLGCNQESDIEENLYRDISSGDTLYYHIHNDTLSVNIGLNYLCCTPFSVMPSTTENSFDIFIIDDCDISQESCYCKCYCLYEFVINFGNYTPGEYELNVHLRDPHQDEDLLLYSIIIED